MKCPDCQADTTYPQRRANGGHCSKCGRRFALEPRAGDKQTDVAFAAAIERVSSGGTVRFTPQHLYYEVARRARGRGGGIPWARVCFAIASLLLGLTITWVFLLPAAVLAFSAIKSWPSDSLQLDALEFERMWGKWLAVHGQPAGLIVRRALPAGDTAARQLPHDIHHYSFDRAVITDREETVDVLLANNFHFENNCAILAANGYPPAAFDTVRAMLRQNPKLEVYVLHDASVEGCKLAERVRSEGWFLDSARIVDVGLRPRHAGLFKGFWKAATPSGASLRGLPDNEVTWLRLYTLELAVIRPEQIVKRLFRAMSGDPDRSAADGGGVVIVDSTSFGSDSTASDGGGDSFG